METNTSALLLIKNVLDQTTPFLTQVGFLAVASEFGKGIPPMKGSRKCAFALSGQGPEETRIGLATGWRVSCVPSFSSQPHQI